MSQKTKIEWCSATWNPWIGCTKVSPGCAHCYAENSAPTRIARANGRELWGKGKARQRTSAAYWKQPLKWNRTEICQNGHGPYSVDAIGDCPECGSKLNRPRVFPSLCDWLDDEVPIEWLADFLKLIHDTPNLDWLLLTKRPELFDRRLQDVINRCERMSAFEIYLREWTHGGNPPINVWIGASVEDQPRADQRIPKLLKIPAKVRFLSVEPLISPVDLSKWLHEDSRSGVSGPSSSGLVSGEIGRYNMENDGVSGGRHSLSEKDKTKTGGREPFKDRRIQEGDVPPQREEVESSGPPNNLDDSKRVDDSRHHGDQPQRRKEGQQLAIEFGDSHAERQRASFVPRTSKEEKSATWRGKRNVESDTIRGSGNQNASQGAGISSMGNREEVRNNTERGVGDCKREKLGAGDLVIVGGESGPGARPCNVEWIRDIVRQYKAAGVATFVKQLGSVAVEPTKFADGSTVGMCLKHPKGGDPSEWPQDLRVREFPVH